MKILFLAPRVPLPADTGGKIRTFNLIRELARKHDVTLLCFSFEDGDHFFLNEFLSHNIKAHLVPHKNKNFLQKAWMVFTGRLPFSAAKYRAASMAKAIKGLLAATKFDAVHIDHIHMAHYIPLFQGMPCLVDEHNVEYRILERCAGVSKLFMKKLLFTGQARKMRHFESKMLATAQACTAVSSDDAKLLERMLPQGPQIDILPNGVDTDYFRWPLVEGQETQEEEAVVFTGSMDWLPNDDSVMYFCKDILPFVWSVNKDVKLYIVGKSPSTALQEMARKDERIILTGRVDDVRTYVARAKVFVVPLRIGGGTRLKILEALSMGKAVVSTSIGAEGIEYIEDRNIVLADTPEIFAEKVLYLMKDQPWRQALGAEGRKLVLAKYDWRIMGQKLDIIFDKVCSI